MWRKLLLIVALLVPATARAEWREAETAHFKIYSDGSERQLVRFAERLEAVDTLLRMATNVGQSVEPVKVRIILLYRTDDVRRAYSGSDPDVAGFYTVNMHGPLAVSPRRSSDSGVFGPEVILFHEYAHHFMLQYLPAAYPGWVIEGFAELISTADVMNSGRINYGKAASHRGYSLTSSRWVTARDMLVKPADELPKDSDFYGQSWLLAHYLILSDKRPGQLSTYLSLIQRGASREEAAKQAFGDLDRLNSEVRSYLEQASFPYRPVEIDKDKLGAVKVRRLSAAEADLMFEVAAFRDNPSEKEGKDYLADLRRKVAAHAADPFALRLLADAEYAAGEYDAAMATVERLLTIRPDDPRGMLRKGELLLAQADEADDRAARIAEARKLIVAANRANPDDPQPLLAYYRTYRAAGERPPSIAIDGLLQAVATVPQDDAARMLLVEALANHGRYAEAAHFLEPLAYDPHKSSDNAETLALLKKLREQAAQASES